MKEIEARNKYQFKDIASMSETARNRLFDYLFLAKVECHWPRRHDEYLLTEVGFPLALVGEERIGIPYFANDIEVLCIDEENEAVLFKVELEEPSFYVLRPGESLELSFEYQGKHEKSGDYRVGTLRLALEKHSFYFSSVDGTLSVHEEIKDVAEDAILGEKDFELKGISEQDSQTHLASDLSGFSYFPWVIDENRRFILLAASKQKRGETLYSYFPLWLGKSIRYQQRKADKNSGKLFQLTIDFGLKAKEN